MSTPEQDVEGDKEYERMQAILDPIIKKALDQIGEHSDSVRIFVTKYIPGADSTIRMSQAQGNFFAQYGQIEAWIQHQKGFFHKDGADSADAAGDE